jgi:hypothetical protein
MEFEEFGYTGVRVGPPAPVQTVERLPAATTSAVVLAGGPALNPGMVLAVQVVVALRRLFARRNRVI